jgi:hypothetical protein
MAMELLAGETLTAWRERAKPGRRELAGVLARIGRALEAVHDAGFTHGAVAAERVQIEASGRVVLFGFRLARGSQGPDEGRTVPASPMEATRPAARIERGEAKPVDDDAAYIALVREVLADAPSATTVSEMVGALEDGRGVATERGPRRGPTWTVALALAATVGAVAGTAAVLLRDDPPPAAPPLPPPPPPPPPPAAAVVEKPPADHAVAAPVRTQRIPQALGAEERAQLQKEIDEETARDPSLAGLIEQVERGGIPTRELVVGVLTNRSRALANALLIGAQRDVDYNTTAEMFTAVTGRDTPNETLDSNTAGEIYEWWISYSGPTALCRLPIEPRVRSLHAIAFLAQGLTPEMIAVVADKLDDHDGCERLSLELLDVALDDETSRPGALRLAADLRRQGKAALLTDAMRSAGAPPLARMLALSAIVLAGEPFPLADLPPIIAASTNREHEVFDRLRFIDAELARTCGEAWSKPSAPAVVAQCHELLPRLHTRAAGDALRAHLAAIAKGKGPLPAWRDALAQVYRSRGEGVPAGLEKWDPAELTWRTERVLQ